MFKRITYGVYCAGIVVVGLGVLALAFTLYMLSEPPRGDSRE